MPLAFISVIAACLFSGALRAQPPITGQLLVATATQTDPNFSSTVLLLLHHADDGSIGVFLNRPTWIQPGPAFADNELLANFPGPLFLGGPIAPMQLFILLRADENPDYGGTRVLEDVYIVPNLEILDDAAFAGAEEGELRLYAGQANWAPGRLEAEISAGHWRVRDGSAELIFGTDPRELWQKTITAEADLVFIPGQ